MLWICRGNLCECILDGRKLHCNLHVKKVKVKAVCGSYSTAALRHIVLLPK